MKMPLTYEEVHLRDYLYILRKRRWTIIFFAALIFGFGVVYTCFEKVVYRATSTILIERENPNVVDFKEVMAFDASSTDYYQTQFQMLRSRSLIDTLIQKENLENDPFLTGARKRSMLRGLFAPFERYLPVWFQGLFAKPPLSEIFIKKMLRIEPMRNSRLVEVSVLHSDSARSAELTNRLIGLFIDRNLEDRFLISKRANDLLSEQLVELKEKVSAAEHNLQTYKEKSGLINIPSVRKKDQFVQDAKLELMKAQGEEARLSKRYLPAHPKMISIRSQIEGLEESLKNEESKTLELSRVAIQYAELERESETARKIYEALLSRFEETQSAAQTAASNIMVVDKATPPPRPFKPRPFLNIMVALFVGILGGILLAFFEEYLDPTVRIPDDIEKVLGLSVFGIIPHAQRIWRSQIAKGELFVQGKKPSTVSESFRALRTALLFKLRHIAGGRILITTSANPSEGKSTISLNLAAAFQQNNLKVILIDGDLRKPRLHRLFDLSSEKGLSDILESNLPLHEAIHRNVGETGIDFLSCGTHSNQPTEILGSEKMKQTMHILKESYDIVIIDSPPFHAVADVAVLNEYADAVIIVARYRHTHRRHLRDVKKLFGENEQKLFGVVINQVSVREKDYYYHQYYYYGYGDARGKK